MRTLNLRNIQPEVVALFEHALPAFLNEIVKASGEARHALAQVFETKVDAWERVGH